MSASHESARLWLVDGFNLLHACFLPEGKQSEWWTQPMQQRVCERLVCFAARHPVWVVFDAHSPATADETPNSSLVVRHAPDADEFIVATVRRLAGVRPVGVVSADRSLVERCRHGGASALSPWALCEWLTYVDDTAAHTSPHRT